jgi:hypothetical protein
LIKKQGRSLSGDLEAAIEAMKNVTWTALEELKGDRDILKKIADTEARLQSLSKALRPPYRAGRRVVFFLHRLAGYPG